MVLLVLFAVLSSKIWINNENEGNIQCHYVPSHNKHQFVKIFTGYQEKLNLI